MAAFLTELVLRDDGTGETFTLYQDFVYRSDLPLPAWLVRVPAGFVTDFASVPRGLWNILPKTGPWDKASVLHDWLYRQGLLDRALVDRLFFEAMGVSHVPAWKRWVMYLGVRLGGRSAWDRYRRQTD